mmetsp:Transcript_15398/g.58233  ORF Transcript_15398/g.58233 Transcript_15398/m.58233 type:complete len:226 (+) Transcript_15398:107-784(+)
MRTVATATTSSTGTGVSPPAAQTSTSSRRPLHLGPMKPSALARSPPKPPPTTPISTRGGTLWRGHRRGWGCFASRWRQRRRRRTCSRPSATSAPSPRSSRPRSGRCQPRRSTWRARAAAAWCTARARTARISRRSSSRSRPWEALSPSPGQRRASPAALSVLWDSCRRGRRRLTPPRPVPAPNPAPTPARVPPATRTGAPPAKPPVRSLRPMRRRGRPGRSPSSR